MKMCNSPKKKRKKKQHPFKFNTFHDESMIKVGNKKRCTSQKNIIFKSFSHMFLFISFKK